MASSALSGPVLGLLGVIRVLILLHLALHSRDVSNAIQHDQNAINRESDASSRLFKLRRNGFCQGLLIRHFLLYVCVSFIQNEVQGAMWKPHLNCGEHSLPRMKAVPSAPRRPPEPAQPPTSRPFAPLSARPQPCALTAIARRARGGCCS